MDKNLGDLISAAAPPVAERSDGLMRELHGMIVDTEATGAPRTRRRMSRAVGAISIAIIGVVGAGAAANAGLETPLFGGPEEPVIKATSGTGRTECSDTFIIHPLNDPSNPVGWPERKAAIAAGQKYLNELDVTKIDLTAAIKQAREDIVWVKGTDPSRVGPSAAQIEETIKSTAYNSEIRSLLQAEMKRQGLSTHAFDFEQGGECKGGDSQ